MLFQTQAQEPSMSLKQHIRRFLHIFFLKQVNYFFLPAFYQLLFSWILLSLLVF